MMRDRADSASGKVNLFYLALQYRGRGLGEQLEKLPLAIGAAEGMRQQTAILPIESFSEILQEHRMRVDLHPPSQVPVAS